MSSDVKPAPISQDSRNDSVFPALEAEPGSLSARTGSRLSGVHPVLVFLGGIVLSYLALASTTLLVGLFFTETILPLGGLEEADADTVEWLVDQRTPTLNDVSFFGSEISGGIVLPILVVLLAIGFAIRRHWLAAVFALFCVALESATYRTTVFFVDRERPDVVRLDDLPPDASFPSGHVAASIAVYGGLALLVTSRLTSGVHRAIVWGIAVAIPLDRRRLSHVPRDAPSTRHARGCSRRHRRARPRRLRRSRDAASSLAHVTHETAGSAS